MYDIDGNGVIDQKEMTKIIQGIYGMIGGSKFTTSAEEKTKSIFAKMDDNNDGTLNEEEFINNCLQDEELCRLLAPCAANN